MNIDNVPVLRSEVLIYDNVTNEPTSYVVVGYCDDYIQCIDDKQKSNILMHLCSYADSKYIILHEIVSKDGQPCVGTRRIVDLKRTCHKVTGTIFTESFNGYIQIVFKYYEQWIRGDNCMQFLY